MFDTHVVPYLKRFSDGGLFSRAVRVVSLGESRMAEMLGDLIEGGTNPTLAPYAKDGEAMVRVTARARNREEADKLTGPVIEEIKRRLGRSAYGVDVPSLESVAAGLLREAGLTISTAEIGSGGLAAQRLQGTEDAPAVCGPGLSAVSGEDLARVLGLEGGLGENRAEACAALSRQACGRLHTDAALVVDVRPKEVACAVTVQDETRQYAQTLPARGGDYYRVQATQAALDMLRLMLLDRAEAAGPRT